MGRSVEAEGTIRAAERVSASVRRVTIMAGINLALTAVLLGVVIAQSVATWR